MFRSFAYPSTPVVITTSDPARRSWLESSARSPSTRHVFSKTPPGFESVVPPSPALPATHHCLLLFSRAACSASRETANAPPTLTPTHHSYNVLRLLLQLLLQRILHLRLHHHRHDRLLLLLVLSVHRQLPITPLHHPHQLRLQLRNTHQPIVLRLTSLSFSHSLLLQLDDLLVQHRLFLIPITFPHLRVALRHRSLHDRAQLRLALRQCRLLLLHFLQRRLAASLLLTLPSHLYQLLLHVLHLRRLLCQLALQPEHFLLLRLLRHHTSPLTPRCPSAARPPPPPAGSTANQLTAAVPWTSG